MTKKIATFSGWGQPYDALKIVAGDAEHIRYNNFDDIDKLFASIKGNKYQTVIGWSLGGQIALRALDAGIISADKLVLIAAPFQFISENGMHCGMDIDTYTSFENMFNEDKQKTLQYFATLIAKNDRSMRGIARDLKSNMTDNLDNLSYWLGQLRNFSSSSLSFADIPQTTIICGQDDTIVDVTQSGLFGVLIKDCSINILEKCGHAPHMHDSEKVKELIK
jgi:pimeloyl-ACP methyl ester carboxylesterase